jgi:hypothetical protein
MCENPKENAKGCPSNRRPTLGPSWRSVHLGRAGLKPTAATTSGNHLPHPTQGGYSPLKDCPRRGVIPGGPPLPPGNFHFLGVGTCQISIWIPKNGTGNSFITSRKFLFSYWRFLWSPWSFQFNLKVPLQFSVFLWSSHLYWKLLPINLPCNGLPCLGIGSLSIVWMLPPMYI